MLHAFLNTHAWVNMTYISTGGAKGCVQAATITINAGLSPGDIHFLKKVPFCWMSGVLRFSTFERNWRAFLCHLQEALVPDYRSDRVVHVSLCVGEPNGLVFFSCYASFEFAWQQQRRCLECSVR